MWVVTGSALAGLAVAAGAFGAHALKTRLSPELLGVFETAVRYQLAHALALVLVGVLAERWASSYVAAAGWCFAGGILLFSGSLYALVGTGVKMWGAVTPIGGLLFLAGWAALGLAGWRK